MNRYKLVFVFSLAFSFISLSVSAITELPEQTSPCEASMFARNCDSAQNRAFNSALEAGDFLFYLSENLKPQYASMDPDSISLIFELG